MLDLYALHNRPPDKGWYLPTDFIHMIELSHLYWCCATVYILSRESGIVLEKCFICVVLNISFPFFEQIGMLAFSYPLVFAQQDHPPLKKNMEYVK